MIKPFYISILSFLFGIIISQAVFYLVSSKISSSKKISISAMFVTEDRGYTAEEVANRVLDLKKLGVIDCVKVVRGETDDVFIDESMTRNCSAAKDLSWTNNSNTIDVRSSADYLWHVSFVVASSEELFSAIWLVRIAILLLSTVLYFVMVSNERIQRRLMENKAASAQQLVQLSRQVAHDIRSPLSALSAVAASLQDIPEDRLALIKNVVIRINDIANDLLHKSKGDVISEASVTINHMPVKNEVNDVVLLDEIIKSVASEKRALLQNRNIELTTDILGEKNFVEANAKELSRVLSNLCNNAIEAFPEGSGKITLALRSSREKIQISIQDNGKGIPADVLSKLGQPGISYGKEGSDSGSGLGVFHAKKYVESIGGQFSILSQVGVGTMIQIQLANVGQR